MIVFAIKSCSFSKADSYSFGWKSYISYFLLFFYRKIIRVVYAIFAIAIKDLEIHVDNLNLLLRKSIIWFESLAQKRETSKQIADTQCYKYQESFIGAYACFGKT